MTLDYGTGVSRTLDAVARQFSTVVWQKGKPPLDSELNLMGQEAWEQLRQVVQSAMPSGFIMDPTRALEDFRFDPKWSNFFVLGNPRVPFGTNESAETIPVVWANVNGWVIPVCGTDVTREGDLTNQIRLFRAPETDSRIDFVFLEAWQARVDANPSTVNKPSASTIWKYGNVKYGGTNIADDLQDPVIRRETTARIQVQYRIRVHGQGVGLGASVALDVYPDGMEDPHVLGQGTAALPVANLGFTNMRTELGDPSLWRAGDGDTENGLGTVDGYVYAIPICAVFRRHSGVYVAVEQAGNPDQNGAFCRTPGTAGAKLLTSARLTNALGPTAAADPAGLASTVAVTGLNGCGLEDGQHVLSSTFLVLDNEIIGISAVDLVNSTITIPAGGRGRYGTAAVGHPANTGLRFFNTRPDGLYADQIVTQDVLDLRRAVNPNDWDFSRLLAHNVGALVKGSLRSTWKKSATGDTQGVTVHEVDYLHADGGAAAPNHTEAIDGPDGIRTVWSDAAVIQPDVTVLLDNDATQDHNLVGLTTEETFDATNGYAWDVAPDFHPSGFMNVGTGGGIPSNAFTNGTSIFLFLGGRTGSGGARGTFRDGDTRAVRAVMPYEYWKSGYPVVDPNNGNQYPWTLRFLNQRAHEPPPPGSTKSAAQYPGPMYPWRDTNFERPFIVLGGLLRSDLKIPGIPVTKLANVGNTFLQIDLGIDFDLEGSYYHQVNGEFLVDVSGVSHPLLRGERTLFGMLTDNGQDRTGASSEVYVVLYGDTVAPNNNGAFKVIGAGTVGYTTHSAANGTSIVVQPLTDLGNQVYNFDSGTGKQVTVEFRSQHHNADDTSSYDTKVADIVVVMTDIGGLDNHPWNRDTLGRNTAYDLSMPISAGVPAVASKALIGMTLMYHPGRGGTARIADDIVRFSMRGGVTETIGAYLRQAPGVVDTTFGAIGMPANEAFWDSAHVQTWNRLRALGWHAPVATNYGGTVIGFTEQDREHELLVDKGSKTVIFRPFRDREMTLQALTYTSGIANGSCLFGPYNYPDGNPKDAEQMFTGANAISGKQMGFVLPREFMPRFGRQDIPYYRDVSGGAGPFLPGINHLFRDASSISDPVFHIIGGFPTSTGVPDVKPMFFATGVEGVAVTYGHAGTMPAQANDKPFIGARRTTDLNANVQFAPEIIKKLNRVHSTDFGKGLRGIQLPPYYGLARVYGVYDARDYLARGGTTFKANRFELENDPAPNLLREDACQQTLFILQDGAKDFTGAPGDHTYIIPENALDLTRALNYQSGDDFTDFHFVVECTVFGFARGFINQNNLVMMRRFGGNGTSFQGNGSGNADGDNPEIKGVHMVIPCPAGFNDQFYVAYNRTAYQGDPYMSRKGTSKTSSDYEVRYGGLSVGAQWASHTPIEQFDSQGVFVPQTPNLRAFEVLASMDFYTTMGTGKIGGDLFPGTPLDVGHIEDTSEAADRHPANGTANSWRVEPRSFTEGQKSATNRAGLNVVFDFSKDLNPQSGRNAYIRFGLLDSTDVDIYFSHMGNNLVALLAAVPSIDGSYVVATDIEQDVRVIQTDYVLGNQNILAGQHHDFEILAYPPDITDQIVVTWVGSTPPDTLLVRAYKPVDQADHFYVRVENIGAGAAATNGLSVQIAVLRTIQSNRIASDFADTINSHPKLLGSIKATTIGNAVWVEAVPIGAQGNDITVELRLFGTWSFPDQAIRFAKLVAPHSNEFISTPTFSHLLGGVDVPVNAGNGTSQIDLTGMTERLPLGVLLQDSDFMCENPLGDNASAMKSSPVGPRPIQTLMPFTNSGSEFTRFFGEPGELLAMADGSVSVLNFGAWRNVSEGGGGQTGSRTFRIYRGGGTVFVLSGENPGGPVDWVTETIPASLAPVLKGGVLVCRAMLVRNFREEVKPSGGPYKVSDGDEIQLVVITRGILGDGATREDGVTLDGVISPSGYGEGWVAADRYQVNGRPMFRGFSRQIPNPSEVSLAVFPDDIP